MGGSSQLPVPSSSVSDTTYRYRMKCTRKPDPTHPTYDQWCEGHKTECKIFLMDHLSPWK